MATPQLRKAIETVVAQRGLHLDHDDLAAIVDAAAEASAWLTDEQAMYLCGRSNAGSLRAYCSRHGVTRQSMVHRTELDMAVRGMPGRGFHPRVKPEENGNGHG